MAKKSIFSEQNLLDKGFVKQPDGTYKPSKISIIESKIDKAENIIAKEVLKKTTNFTANPPTSWFIKGNVPSKKNARQNFVKNGKQISIPSKLHAAYVKSTAMQYEVFGREFRAAVEHYKVIYPLYVEFHFVRGSKHSFDLCNACQTCEDIMKDQVSRTTGAITKKGWIPDDSADFLIPVFKPYDYDKSNPGVHIKLITSNHV
jgi:hypothetical protein